MIRRILPVALLAAVALAVGACGDDEVADGPATFAPPESFAYVEVVLDPSDEQAEAIDGLVERVTTVPFAGQLAEPGDLIAQAVDQAASDAGLDISFEEDLRPWLGERAGFSSTMLAGEVHWSVAIETSDEDAARAALERLLTADGSQVESVELGGVEAMRPEGEPGAIAVVDGAVVFSPTDEGFEVAVSAHDDDNLAESDELADLFGALDDSDPLARAFIDPEVVLASGEAIADSGEPQALAGAAMSPQAVGLAVRDDAIVLDTVGAGEGAGDGELLASGPARALGVIALDALGERVDVALEQIGAALEPFQTGEDERGLRDRIEEVTGTPVDELAAALGDTILYVSGEPPETIAIAAKVGVDSDEEAGVLLGALENAFADMDDTRIGPPLDGEAEGFSAEPTEQVVDTPFRYFTAQAGDGVVELALASDSGAADAALALEDGGRLADDENFVRATQTLGSDFVPVAYANTAEIIRAAVGGASVLELALSGGNVEEAIPALLANKVPFAAAGTREIDDDTHVVRFVIGVN